jgi:hypothetical protein
LYLRSVVRGIDWVKFPPLAGTVLVSH